MKNPVDDMLTNDEFVSLILQMVRDKWKYDRPGGKGMDYKNVDCVSVYRYVMKLYYWGYGKYVPKDTYNVNQLVQNCCYDLQEIEQNGTNLEIGMAVLMKDSSGYYHVGYYIGYGKVMESNYLTEKGKIIVDGCRIISLEGSNYTECAYLNGIDYSYILEYVE